MRFAAFLCLLPLIPPAPFSHTGRRGSLGVLMAETGDGTQGLAEKPALVWRLRNKSALPYEPSGSWRLRNKSALPR